MLKKQTCYTVLTCTLFDWSIIEKLCLLNTIFLSCIRSFHCCFPHWQNNRKLIVWGQTIICGKINVIKAHFLSWNKKANWPRIIIYGRKNCSQSKLPFDRPHFGLLCIIQTPFVKQCFDFVIKFVYFYSHLQGKLWWRKQGWWRWGGKWGKFGF